MTNEKIEGVDKGSLSDRIRVELTDRISDGTLPSGTILEEGTLAETYGVSRTPVRDALRQLEALGLIEIRPRRGAVVLPLTLSALMEAFEVTAEIEALCAKLATHRMSGLERAELTRLHEASSALVQAQNHDEYDAFNLRFHEAIYVATHNEFLVAHAVQLRNRLLPFRRSQLRHPGRLVRSHGEHNAVLICMLRGDGNAAAAHMREHMLNAASAIALLRQGHAEAGDGR
ncbi:GntR family transcriptional regulator [Brucella intermedia]|uniref:GntR family transcriptional regulator n=1 Tax=Brucella intermedia TaxID=94625 RepID=UPI00224A6789|nr:GntR family transcriptional regulator [Brucella intermedia]